MDVLIPNISSSVENPVNCGMLEIEGVKIKENVVYSEDDDVSDKVSTGLFIRFFLLCE